MSKLIFMVFLFAANCFAAENPPCDASLAGENNSLGQVQLRVEHGLNFAGFEKYKGTQNITDVFIDIATITTDAYIGRSILIGREFLINGQSYLAERAESKFTFVRTLAGGDSDYIFYMLRDAPFAEKYIVIEHNRTFDTYFIHRMVEPVFDPRIQFHVNIAKLK